MTEAEQRIGTGWRETEPARLGEVVVGPELVVAPLAATALIP